MVKSSGEHKTTEYAIGRGILYLATDRDANGRPKGYSDRGNVAELTCNIDEETLEHISTRAGLAVQDAEVSLSKKLQGTFVLENFTLDNLALFLSGVLSQVVKSSTPVVGVANIKDIKLGEWFDLFETAAPASYPLHPNLRAYAISAVTVDETGGGALVLDTDYKLDLVLGRVFVIPDGGTLVDGDDLDVDFTFGALNLEIMKAFKTSQILAAAKFRMVNPQDSNRILEFQFHEINVKPEGDLALIGNEWARISLAFTAQANELVDSTSPTLTITGSDHADFLET